MRKMGDDQGEGENDADGREVVPCGIAAGAASGIGDERK
jgi:hypothetical protein